MTHNDFLGIAFALTIQDAIGAGISILIAMIIKLIPQKLGDAVILSKAGLNHFWENVLSLLAVCSVYIGAIVGMALRSQLSSAQPYFFGALSGIFLYISLSSLFPVLHDIIDDNEIISKSLKVLFRGDANRYWYYFHARFFSLREEVCNQLWYSFSPSDLGLS